MVLVAAVASAEKLIAVLEQGGAGVADYARPHVLRAVAWRMAQVGAKSHSAYAACFERFPAERARFADALSVPVTWFFRDLSQWAHVANTVIPNLLARRNPKKPVRVWCAGCATGEEAYSIAMVVAHAVGVSAVHRRSRIVGTDVSEVALSKARCGVFPPWRTRAVPPEAWRYLELRDHSVAVMPDLQFAVAFERHDLLRDPPFPRVDLLVCRNVLLYLSAAGRRRVFTKFHAALADGGALWLGTADGSAPEELFAGDVRTGVFMRASSATSRPLAPSPLAKVT
jgi:two-component system CheB/CheR fusion protein